jgi:hypothetical protein
LWPDAKHTNLGKHDVYEYEGATPAHSYVYVLKLLSTGRAIELTARDSYDRPLANFMLDQLQGVTLPKKSSTTITVRQADFGAQSEFQCLVIVPPKVARRFEHESEVLMPITYWVVPAIAGEFEDGGSAEDFYHQLYRKDGWKVHVVQWNRERKTKPNWN